MIKNKDNLKKKIKDALNKKADELVEDFANKSDEDEFTIDIIEDIMTRFNTESKQIMIDTINEAIASFDEKEIISKKNEKLRD